MPLRLTDKLRLLSLKKDLDHGSLIRIFVCEEIKHDFRQLILVRQPRDPNAARLIRFFDARKVANFKIRL